MFILWKRASSLISSFFGWQSLSGGLSCGEHVFISNSVCLGSVRSFSIFGIFIFTSFRNSCAMWMDTSSHILWLAAATAATALGKCFCCCSMSLSIFYCRRMTLNRSHSFFFFSLSLSHSLFHLLTLDISINVCAHNTISLLLCLCAYDCVTGTCSTKWQKERKKQIPPLFWN